MKKIAIINGPNLNLVGKRETSIYGDFSLEDYLTKLKENFSDVDLSFYQSNIEGEIVNFIQTESTRVDGIILNAGGYSHTSVAILDAIRAVNVPVVEVHISNIYAREPYRRVSLLSEACVGVIAGFGLEVYRLGLLAVSRSFGT
ncbi:MAG: 3-dehydroquinate dehydratase [Lentimicrobiaceae bacterium]|nr:3-dehydroquinate dehydratase [Lentimicrobiaceae bacterium]